MRFAAEEVIIKDARRRDEGNVDGGEMKEWRGERAGAPAVRAGGRPELKRAKKMRGRTVGEKEREEEVVESKGQE